MIYYKLNILGQEHQIKTVKDLVKKINDIIIENRLNSNLITHHIITRMVCKHIYPKKWDFINIEKLNTKNFRKSPLSLNSHNDIE